MKIRLNALLTALLVTSLVAPAFPQSKSQAVPQQQKKTSKSAKHAKVAVPEKPKTLEELATTELTQDEAINHILNRLGYGPRPGDVERVRTMGLEKYIVAQLHPETLDSQALDGRLKRYTTLAMSSADLIK